MNSHQDTIPRAHAGYSVLSRTIDLALVAGLTALINNGSFIGPYIVFYLAASFVGGQTPGRFSAGCRLVKRNGEKPGVFKIFLRDMFFLILLPLIVLQWAFGVGLSHERITDVITVKADNGS